MSHPMSRNEMLRFLIRLGARGFAFAAWCYLRGVVGALLLCAGVFAFSEELASLEQARRAVEACFTTLGVMFAVLFAIAYLAPSMLCRGVTTLTPASRARGRDGADREAG